MPTVILRGWRATPPLQSMKCTGNAGATTLESLEFLSDKIIKKSTGKQLLKEDFNLGKSIISQGADLKAKIFEHTLDAAIEKKQQKSANNDK